MPAHNSTGTLSVVPGPSNLASVGVVTVSLSASAASNVSSPKIRKFKDSEDNRRILVK